MTYFFFIQPLLAYSSFRIKFQNAFVPSFPGPSGTWESSIDSSSGGNSISQQQYAATMSAPLRVMLTRTPRRSPGIEPRVMNFRASSPSSTLVIREGESSIRLAKAFGSVAPFLIAHNAIASFRDNPSVLELLFELSESDLQFSNCTKVDHDMVPIGKRFFAIHIICQ
jgi:hypothetical protein